MGRTGITEQDAIIRAKEILNVSNGKYIGFLYNENNKLLINFMCSCERGCELTLSRLKASKGFCPLCRYERTANKLSYTYEEVRNIFENNNCLLHTKFYTNTSQNLDFTCSCGNPLGHKTLRKFLQSPRCDKCGRLSSSKSRISKYDDILFFYEQHGCELLLKEEDYINKRTEANFTCACGRNGCKSITLFYKSPYCKSCGLEKGYFKTSTSYEEMKEFVSQTSKCEVITPKELYENSQSNIELKCECGKPFTTKFAYFKHENKRQCNECGIGTRSGEYSYRWKGGLTSEDESFRKSIDYKNWRIEVYKRDNYTCQCCGDSKGGNLQAHHIENFSDNEELRLVLDNGVTLCNDCHNFSKYGSFHHVYGTHNNTKEQLEEYIKRYGLGEFKDLQAKNLG